MNEGFVIAGELMLHSGCRLDAFPRPDEHVLMDKVSLGFGGPAFNMARNLVNLGCQVALTGPAGNMDREKFHREGPGPDSIPQVWIEGHSDLLFTVRSGGGHFSVYQRAEVESEQVAALEEICRDARLLVLTGSRHEHIRETYVRLSDTSDAKLVFAPNYALGRFDERTFQVLFEAAEVTALNEDETKHACWLLNCANVGDLSRRTAGTLIVTRAEKGAEIFLAEREKPVRVPSASLRSDDVFGAGDAFLSGFLDARYERHLDLDDAGFWAGAMAGVFARLKVNEEDLPFVDRPSVDEVYQELRKA